MGSNGKPRRKGRPLLVAAAGVAVMSFVQCHSEQHVPVGNLMAPQPPVDAAAPTASATESAPAAPAAPSAPAPSATTEQASPPPVHPHHPVGNLRPPPPRLDAGGPSPHPVGNLRPPP